MIFGLSNSQAAATLAAVMIGHEIVVGHTAEGLPITLFGDAVLNGTVVMILVTCIISSLATEHAARQLAVQADHIDNEMTEEKLVDRILIPLYNPDTLNSLMDLAVLLKVNKSKEPLYAVNVSNDTKDGTGSLARGKKLLERAARIASATDNTVRMISRYDANVTSGIIHTIKENSITEVVMGLHHKTHFADSFFGAKTENLLKATNQMILISKSVQPLSTIKRLVVAVPAKAEYENGFVKSIRCIEMQLGEPDDRGRRRPVPIEGSEYELPMETVIIAIGNSPNPLIKKTTPDLPTERWGGIRADENGRTGKKNVYAGGDAVTGAATVILAMGAGKKAAAAILEDHPC